MERIAVFKKDIDEIGADAIVCELKHKTGHPDDNEEALNYSSGIVIHAMVPKFEIDMQRPLFELASAYRTSLEIAEQLGAESIAFDCLGRGDFGFPSEIAVEIAFQVFSDFRPQSIKIISISCNDETDYQNWLRVIIE